MLKLLKNIATKIILIIGLILLWGSFLIIAGGLVALVIIGLLWFDNNPMLRYLVFISSTIAASLIIYLCLHIISASVEMFAKLLYGK